MTTIGRDGYGRAVGLWGCGRTALACLLVMMLAVWARKEKRPGGEGKESTRGNFSRERVEVDKGQEKL